MKKYALFLFFCMMAADIHAEESVLKSRSDTLSYCTGLVYGKSMFTGNTVDLVTSEEEKQAYLKGVKETLPTTFGQTSKAFAVGSIFAVFITDTYDHNKNAFSIPDLIQGIKDGAAQNYEKMDTTTCFEVLKGYKQPSWNEEIKDMKRFQDASYAYGMLRMLPRAAKAAMDEYEIPQEEQDIKQYAAGFECILSQLIPPKDAYSFGKIVGNSMKIVMSDSHLDWATISYDLLLRGLEDAILSPSPLMTQEEAERILIGNYSKEDILDISDDKE